MTVALLLASAVALVATEGPAVSLEWSAPAGCPSANEVQDDIDAWLGGVGELGEPLAVEADVVLDRDGYALTLVMETRTGRDLRRIRADTCEQLARVTSLVVATMQDPVAVSDQVEPLRRAAVAPPPSIPEAPSLSPSEPTPDELPEAGGVSVSESEAPSRPHSPWRPALRLEGVVGSAVLPRVDAGLAFAVGLTRSRLRFELGASHLFAQTDAHPTLSDVGLRIRSTTGLARACGVPGWGSWELPLCVAGEVGSLAARGVGSEVRGATMERSLYASALVEVHVVWRATDRLGLWLGAQGVVSLTRPSFTVDPLDPFFTAPLGGGRAKLGVEVRFP